MDPDAAQRRRLFVAIAITVVLVPAAFLLNRADDDADTVATGVVPESTGTGDVDGPDDTSDPMGTLPPGFLDGAPPAPGDQSAVIAIPRPVRGVVGTGTYDNGLRDPTRCASSMAPFDRRITVTNLDNQRSLQCVSSVIPDDGVDDDHAVVLNPDAFATIADFTEAPVPVRVTW